MKSLLLLCAVAALAAFALLVPLGGRTLWARAQERGLPRAAARLTARGLRASWDFIARLGHRTSPPATKEAPPHSQKQMARRPGREGIVPQPPKEKLGRSDRDALDKLVTRAR